MADLDTSLPNLQPQLNPIINAPPAPQSHGGIGNFLGRLGDALLVANGRPAIYAQRQQNAALANYLGQIDPSMGDMVNNGVDAPTALALYKMQHPSPPDIIQEMQAVGIDPNSEQGKQIITSHLNGSSSGPSSVQEYEFAKQNGFGGSYMDFLNQKGGPLIANNGDGTFTIVPRQMVGGGQPTSSASGPPQAAIDYLKAHPDLASAFDQKYGAGSSSKILGGATGSTPSRNFPVNNPGGLRIPGSTQFQKFATPEQGVQAQEALLGRYFQNGRNTVRSVIERYAPRSSNGGDNTDAQVNNYINYVSKRIGVGPDTPLSNVSQLGRAMREFETGQRAF